MTKSKPTTGRSSSKRTYTAVPPNCLLDASEKIEFDEKYRLPVNECPKLSLQKYVYRQGRILPTVGLQRTDKCRDFCSLVMRIESIINEEEQYTHVWSLRIFLIILTSIIEFFCRQVSFQPRTFTGSFSFSVQKKQEKVYYICIEWWRRVNCIWQRRYGRDSLTQKGWIFGSGRH